MSRRCCGWGKKAENYGKRMQGLVRGGGVGYGKGSFFEDGGNTSHFVKFLLEGSGVKLKLMPRHELVNFDLTKDDQNIYRLIEVNHLFELFKTQQLTLVKPKLWDDPYENFLEYCKGIVPSKPDFHITYNSHTEFIFGNCWTLNEDTDAAWRIYSPDKRGVKIKTTVKKLFNSIGAINDKNFSSYIGKVKYLSEDEINTNIRSKIREAAFSEETLVKDFFLNKRIAFVHEQEIRLIVNLNRPDEGYINSEYQDNKNLDICKLPLENPMDLIDEIVFDPRMPDSLTDAYKFYLQEKLKYKKPCTKSSVYSVPNIKEEVENKCIPNGLKS